MPIDTQPEGIYYSKDLFKQAGITSTPTTIDELEADVAKLKAAVSRRSRSAPRTPGRPRTGTTTSRCASAARTR